MFFFFFALLLKSTKCVYDFEMMELNFLLCY